MIIPSFGPYRFSIYSSGQFICCLKSQYSYPTLLFPSGISFELRCHLSRCLLCFSRTGGFKCVENGDFDRKFTAISYEI